MPCVVMLACLLGFVASALEPDCVTILKQLPEDFTEETPAAKSLFANSQETITQLSDYYFPSLDRELGKLDSPSSAERKAARERLKNCRFWLKKEIQEFAKQSDSPEVWLSCKEIAKVLEEQSREQADKGFCQALRFVLLCEEIPVEALPFYHSLCLEIMTLPPQIQQQVEGGIGRLVKAPYKNRLDPIFSYVRARSLGAIKFYLNLEYPSAECEILRAYEKRIRSVEPMMASNDPDAVTEACLVARFETARFAEEFRRIYFDHQDDPAWAHIIEMILSLQDGYRVFAGSYRDFLFSNEQQVVCTGLAFMSSNPTRYRKDVLRSLDNTLALEEKMSFFLVNFPESRDELLPLMMRKYRRGIVDQRVIFYLCLFKKLDCSQRVLDGMWVELMKRHKADLPARHLTMASELMDAVPRLEISPHKVLPFLKDYNSELLAMNSWLQSYLDKHSGEGRDVIQKILSETKLMALLVSSRPIKADETLPRLRAGLSVFLNQSAAGLREEAYSDVLRGSFSVGSYDSDYAYRNWLPYLSEYPGLLDLVTPFLEAKDPPMRLLAALITKEAGLDRANYQPVVLALPLKSCNEEMLLDVIRLLDDSAHGSSEFRQAVEQYIDYGFAEGNRGSRLFPIFCRKHGKLVPVLEKYLKELANSNDASVLLAVSRALLNIDSTNQAAFEMLTYLAVAADLDGSWSNSNVGAVWKAIDILEQSGHRLELSAERMEHLLYESRGKKLRVFTENREKLRPFIEGKLTFLNDRFPLDEDKEELIQSLGLSGEFPLPQGNKLWEALQDDHCQRRARNVEKLSIRFFHDLAFCERIAKLFSQESEWRVERAYLLKFQSLPKYHDLFLPIVNRKLAEETYWLKRAVYQSTLCCISNDPQMAKDAILELAQIKRTHGGVSEGYMTDYGFLKHVQKNREVVDPYVAVFTEDEPSAHLQLYLANAAFRDSGTIGLLKRQLSNEGFLNRLVRELVEAPKLAMPFVAALQNAPYWVRCSFNYHELMLGMERLADARNCEVCPWKRSLK